MVHTFFYEWVVLGIESTILALQVTYSNRALPKLLGTPRGIQMIKA